MRLHVRDRRSAPSLRHRNRAAITVLMCEHKPYPVWLSCRRKNYPYSVKIANVKGVQGIYFAFLIWDRGMLTVAAMSLLWPSHGSFNKSKCLCNIKYRRQLYGARLCSPFKTFTRHFFEDQSQHQTDESFSLCRRHDLTGYEYSRSKRQELTSRQLSEPEILHGACSDQRLLRVVQHMREGIHTNMEVCYVNTHGLLSHSRLISVTWGL